MTERATIPGLAQRSPAHGPGLARTNPVAKAPAGGGRGVQLLGLQRSAGNRAVAGLMAAKSSGSATDASTGAAMGSAESTSTTAVSPVGALPSVAGAVVQRRAGGGHLPMPPSRMKAAADPAFRAMKTRLSQTSRTVKKHPPARSEAKNASGAAHAPTNDVASQAAAAQVEEMGTAKPGGFDKAKFIASVRAAIDRKAPKNLEQADSFGKSGAADEVKNEVKGRVADGKAASAKDIKSKATAKPDTSKATPKQVESLGPQLPTPQAADPGAAAAMPQQAPPEQTNLSTGGDDTKQEMADAEVTDQQLAQSNEPEFQSAAAAKGEAGKHSATAPGPVLAAEKAELQSAKAGASSSTKGSLAAMVGKRTANTGAAHSAKTGAKAKEEAERAKVAADIEQIYSTTKADTERILTDLDGKVSKSFEAGEQDARAAFESSYSKQMSAYKDKRYSGILGKGRWLKDKLTSMPPEVNQFFVTAKALYVQRMDQVISNVADLVGGELTRARARIATGRTQIKTYVSQQKGNLAKYAGEAEKNIGGKFDELDKSVDDKQDGLVDDLASKYTEARNAVDTRIEELQSENKGLWDKAKDLVGGVIKTVLQLKDMLLGVLARAAGVIGKIIQHPIAFLGNLISGIGAGLRQFLSRIGTHLEKGVVGWLLGSLASTGLELPEKFDLKGILHLVGSIIGLTWANFKARLVAKVGAPVAGKIEKGVDFVKAIATGGLGAAWSFIVDKVSDIKDSILGQVKDFLITKVIGAGVEWILGLMTPAGAFIKACKAIYSIVMFFVERAGQIKAFVDSVLDSVESIASGALGKVAGAIEDSLSKILPLAIGFLANLLGLGGITEKIQSILKTVQKPITSAFDFLIGKAAKFGKGLIAKAKNSKIARKARELKAAAKQGVAKVKAKVKELKGRVKAKVLGGDDSPAGKEKRLDLGLAAAVKAVNRWAGKSVSGAILRPILGGLRVRRGLATLDAVPSGTRWAVEGTVQRSCRNTNALVEDRRYGAHEGGPGKLGHAVDKHNQLLPGRVGPYRGLTGKQDPRNKPILKVYAEHVLPRNFIHSFVRAMGFSGMPPGGNSYKDASTVLAYAGAKRTKDMSDTHWTRALAMAQAIGLAIRSRESDPVAKSGAHQDLMQEIERRTQASEIETWKAVQGEDGVNANVRGSISILPTVADIRRAAGDQITQVRMLILDQAFETDRRSVRRK
jgi:hypothetical protein